MKTVAAVLGVLLVLGGGIAYAAIPDSGGVIHGCYKANGDLRVIDPSSGKKDASACKNDETALAWNQAGVQGPAGPQGAPGETGPAGQQGPAGASWTPSYGIGSVFVARGTGSPAPWAAYSTTLGSPAGSQQGPFGDTTGGAFRFTCNAAQAPCRLSVGAEVSGSATATVYPRVLIHKQELSGGPSTYCEYADGADNNGSFEAPGYPLAMGIGGSLDCPGHTQAYPAGGVLTSLEVPAGYYDVWATFVFKVTG